MLKIPIDILIVDDERNIRELLEIILTKAGFDTCTTDDGHEALEVIKNDSVDLVIQDLRMPKMDGIKLLKEIKNISPQLPVVLITAFSSWDTAVEAMRLGAYDYLMKPCDIDKLIAKVEEAAARRRITINEGTAEQMI